jgi:hypothetical protein
MIRKVPRRKQRTRIKPKLLISIAQCSPNNVEFACSLNSFNHIVQFFILKRNSPSPLIFLLYVRLFTATRVCFGGGGMDFFPLSPPFPPSPTYVL